MLFKFVLAIFLLNLIGEKSVKELAEHWNKIYSKSDENRLGWYEEDFAQTLKFINQVPNWQQSKVFVAGAGTSELIEILLKSDVRLILNDLSPEVIERLKKKYLSQKYRIQWNCQNLSEDLPANLKDIDLWIDRAVLHFICEEDQINNYFKNVNKVVKSGGYTLLAEFSKEGAKKCAGLDVRRYDLNDFEKYLPSFQLISSEEYTYTNPSGDPRPYIYALLKKLS